MAGLLSGLRAAKALRRANAAFERYEQSGVASDLEETIEAALSALTGRGLDPSGRGALLGILAIGLLTRHEQGGSLTDLDGATRAAAEALEVTPSDDPNQLGAAHTLVNCLIARHRQRGDPAALDKAAAICRQGIAAASASPRAMAALLDGLGRTLMLSYEEHSAPDHLHRSIEAFRHALRITPEGAPDRAVFLNNLALALRHRYTLQDREEDLTEAIDLARNAVAHARGRVVGQVDLLTTLGVLVAERGERSGDSADLELSIELYEAARALGSDDASASPALHLDLGNALLRAYERTGAVEQLERASSQLELAVETTVPDTSLHLSSVASFAAAQQLRFELEGSIQHLENAIHSSRTALGKESAENAPPTLLTSLGNALLTRFQRTEEIADLEGAIESFRGAVSSVPPGGRMPPQFHANLGLALRGRFELRGDPADLDASLDHYRAAVRLAREAAPSRLPAVLLGLGGSLAVRFRHTLRRADIEEAVALLRLACELAAGSVAYPPALANLGSALVFRTRLSESVTDVEEALDAFQQAMEWTPSMPAMRLILRSNVAAALHRRYELSETRRHLEEAAAAYEDALAALDQHLAPMPPAYLIPQQATWDELTIRAARIYSRAGRTTDALLAGEGGKSRHLTKQMAHRGSCPARGLPGELVSEERILSKRLADLHAAEFSAIQSSTSAGRIEIPSRPEHYTERERVERELTALWRRLEGLGPAGASYVATRRGERLDAEQLHRLGEMIGSDTSVLSLLTTPSGTTLFALGGPASDPVAIDSDLDRQGWIDLWRQFVERVHLPSDSQAPAPPPTDWSAALLPLLERAGPHLEGASRVIVSPMGLGHLLPWVELLDRVGVHAAVVNVPSLGILPLLLARQPVANARCLVIGDPTGDLPGAAAEAVAVAELCGLEPILRQDATVSAALAALEEADVVHFASHAFFSPESSLDSGIVLADGILTAREIATRVEDPPGFVALSACETGMMAPLGGDEFAGLGRVLLHAGVQSVLVSLWAVEDAATSHLMTGFYERWRQQGLDKASALSEAIGATRRHPSWNDAYYWAAFTLIGDWR